MLNRNDMVLIRGALKEALLRDVPEIVNGVIKKTVPEMFREQEKRFDQKLAENFGIQESRFDQKLDDLKVNLRDEIHSTVKASEAGLIRRMDVMEERLHKDLEEFIDDNYSPRMYEAEQQILKINGHLKLA